MKLALAIVGVLWCGGVWQMQAANSKPFVIPEIESWTPGEGSVSLSGRVVVKSEKLRSVAEAFADDYRTMFGRKLTVTKGKARKGDVVLQLAKDGTMGAEGYRLTVNTGISISASTTTGAYWATRTLLQISEQSADRALPCGVIADKPQYALRGFMIDCGRKYIPIDYLRKLVKVMAYYKMNALQIHLNDNGFRQFFGNDWMKTYSAFRLECDTYPGLTAKDGHYTKQEFVELQQLG